MFLILSKKIMTRLFILPILFTLPLLNACKTFDGSTAKNAEGVVYYQQGQYEQALQTFNDAIRINPNNAEAYYNLASTYQKQGMTTHQTSLLAQAENYYRACLDHNPPPETTICCYRGIAALMNERNRGSEALELLQGWESRNQNALDPKLEIAYLLEAQGKNQEALAALQKAGTMAPNDYRIYYKSGVIQQKLGNNQAALDQLLMAGRLQPSDTEIANRITRLRSQVPQSGGQQLVASKSNNTINNALGNKAAPVVAGNGDSQQSSNWKAAQVPSLSMVPPNFSQNQEGTPQVDNTIKVKPTTSSTIATTSPAITKSPAITNGTPPALSSTPAPVPGKMASTGSTPASNTFPAPPAIASTAGPNAKTAVVASNKQTGTNPSAVPSNIAAAAPNLGSNQRTTQNTAPVSTANTINKRNPFDYYQNSTTSNQAASTAPTLLGSPVSRNNSIGTGPPVIGAGNF